MSHGFSHNADAQSLVVMGSTIPYVVAGPNSLPYFHGNEIAGLLGYAKPNQAISKNVRPQQKSNRRRSCWSWVPSPRGHPHHGLEHAGYPLH